MSKAELIASILAELRRAQTERWIPPAPGKVKRLELPPVLPVDGTGGHIAVTTGLLESVRAYAGIWSDNDPSLKLRFKSSDLVDLAGRSFGAVLANIDLARSDPELCDEIRQGVDSDLSRRARYDHRPVDVILGCHLFRGSQAYPIRIGPVVFETREAWLTRIAEEKGLSDTITRRLQKSWSGSRVRKRKSSWDEASERYIFDAVGQRPVVCTVETDGLSSKMVGEKGVLAARLAMTAISLMWSHPAEGLSWMNLIFDGSTFHRRYALLGSNGRVGSSSSLSQMPEGRWVNEELLSDLARYQPIFDVLGECIKSFVQPEAPLERPRLSKSIFLSLWWLQSASCEEADQIATAKFVASMDSLVKGQSAKAIMRFLKVRGSYDEESSLMANGRSTKSVINELYGARRSELLHGSSADFAHDWSGPRSTAEAVARLCLVLACAWIVEHPMVDDLEALSQ